jgi:hypothetical protein
MSLDQMKRQELARALRIEQTGWRAVPGFDRKPRHDGFDHGIANQKLRNDAIPGVAEITIAHGGASGVTFAWEQQLLSAGHK